MRRRFMFASALSTLTILSPAAWADREITDEITEPVFTSTAGDGGVADNIVITSSGRVSLTNAGTAVTLDSDHDVTNQGSISVISDDDGGVGILALGGNSGTVTNSSTIAINDDNLPGDDDGDGRIDGDLAQGSNRVAILVDGTEVFTGDILTTTTSTIVVRGNDSAGVRILTGLDGVVDLAGRITVTGQNSTGVDIQSPVTGDVTIGSTTVVSGEGSTGVNVMSDIDGALRFESSTITNGYRFLSRPTDENYGSLEEEDITQGGSPIIINANVTGGVLFSGPVGDIVENRSVVTVSGSAPGINVFADTNSGDVTLGRVIIRAVPDDPDTDEDESVPEQTLGYALINRGVVTARGELDGIDATAMSLEGRDGQTVTIEGGIENTGTLSASAHGENLISTATPTQSTSLFIGDGVTVPLFTNSGNIQSSTIGGNANAYGVLVSENGFLPTLDNTGVISVATILNDTTANNAFGIVDRSGTLTSISNAGRITINSSSGEGDNIVDTRGVAIDVSGTSDPVLVRQYRLADAEEDFVEQINGDILFGTGDDTLQIETGEVNGDVTFGDGADSLLLTGGSFNGNLFDADGTLNVSVANGALNLNADTDITVSQATFSDGARVTFGVNETFDDAAILRSNGTITFEAGSRISTTLTTLVSDGASFVIVEADQLVIEEALEVLQDTTAPYLYEAAVEYADGNTNSLTLTLRRRSAQELGMTTYQAAAYAAALEAWEGNEELGGAIASLLTADEFFDAYNQLLPEFSGSALQFAVAANDSTAGAVASRLRAMRRSKYDMGGLWAQEFGYYLDRSSDAYGPGYRGQGLGLAFGVDRPAGPFYALGVNFSGWTSEIEEIDGNDQPMTTITGQLGVYGGSKLGMFDLTLYGGVGYDYFESERVVVIDSFAAQSLAEWSGWHAAGSARLSADFDTGWSTYIRPSVSVDYLSLFESAYTETGGGAGIDLDVDDRESSTLSGSAVLAFGRIISSDQNWWSPQMRIGYRNEFGGSDVETTARFAGYNETFTLQGQQMPGSGLLFGLGISGGSDYSTFSLDYDADLREDFVRHTARLVVRLLF